MAADRQVVKKRKRQKPLLENVSAGGNSAFARALGSVDYSTREQGLRALTVWLCRRQNVEEQDLTKVWMGLFYCFWHSDKALVQEDLAVKLAAVLPQLSEQVAVLYFKTFLSTMQREWFGIDKLRLDKFMMLVRKFLRQLFVHLATKDWDAETTRPYMAALERVVLQGDAQPSAGLSFHLADVAVPELLAAARQMGRPLPDVGIRAVADAFAAILARTQRATFPVRLREAVFDALAEELQSPSEGRPLADLNVVDLAAHLFNTGALPGVKTRNREGLYEASQVLERCAGKRRRTQESQEESADKAAPSGLEAPLVHPKQMPEQVPIVEEAPPVSHKKKMINKKKQKERQREQQEALVSAAMTRAGKALGAARQGSTTVRPATPDSPTKVTAASVLQDSLASLVEDGPFGSTAIPALTSRELRQSAASVDNAAGAAAKQPGVRPAAAVNQLEEGSAPVGKQASPVSRLRSGMKPSGSALKAKQVKFALRRNLYHAQAGPVPPAFVRTPPHSRPKGPALKKTEPPLPQVPHSAPQPSKHAKRKSRLGRLSM